MSAVAAEPAHAADESAAVNKHPEENGVSTEAMPLPKDRITVTASPEDSKEEASELGDRAEAGEPAGAKLMGAPPPKAATRPQAPPPQFRQPAAVPQATGEMCCSIPLQQRRQAKSSVAGSCEDCLIHIPQATRLGRQLWRRQRRRPPKRCLRSGSEQSPRPLRRCGSRVLQIDDVATRTQPLVG